MGELDRQLREMKTNRQKDQSCVPVDSSHVSSHLLSSTMNQQSSGTTGRVCRLKRESFENRNTKEVPMSASEQSWRSKVNVLRSAAKLADKKVKF